MTSDTAPRPISPLRARMIEDMTVRGFKENTRRDYVRQVRAFAALIGRSPDTATAEDLRLFQLHQMQIGMQPPSINSAVSALRFFFTVTLDRSDLARRLTVVPYPRRIPAVLSVEEVTLLLRAAQRQSTRRGSPLHMALGCASRKSSRSRLAMSTPSACCCESSRARAARACPRESGGPPCHAIAAAARALCAPGGGRAGAWGCCCRGAGCFPAAIRPSRSRPASSIAPSTLRPESPASRSECRCTRCGTALPRICWNRTLTSASSRACPGEGRGAARPCQARHHGPLHPRGQHHDPYCDQPARSARAADRRKADNRRLAWRPCAAQGLRSQTSFIAMAPPGARPMPGM
jgi:hypothetical protein